MKIGLAQIRPASGKIASNLEKHLWFAEQSKAKEVDFLVFPELSLTAYEPKLAMQLAMSHQTEILEPLQQFCNGHQITVAVGAPVKVDETVKIGMIIFQPNSPRQLYCKQILHEDEFPYFIPGNEQILINNQGVFIAPAICYESLQTEHARTAKELGASIYLASVAKSVKGIEKANAHFPEIARKYELTVLMVNCVGPCDDFESAGQSGVWNKSGELLARLNVQEGLLVFDTLTGISETEVY